MPGWGDSSLVADTDDCPEMAVGLIEIEVSLRRKIFKMRKEVETKGDKEQRGRDKMRQGEVRKGHKRVKVNLL